MLDLERVEVLKGPQGTLFGRITIGGALNRSPSNPVEYVATRFDDVDNEEDTVEAEGAELQ